MKFTLDWLKAAAIRMVRTAAQVALAMLSIGMTVSEVDWLNILSVSLVAAVYSLLTSIVTDLPEAGSDGVIVLEENGAVSGLHIDGDGADVLKKGLVKLKVQENP